MIQPKNGMYMTDDDKQSFAQSFAEMYSKFTGERWTELNVRNVTIVVTEDCNLKCTYCYQHGKAPLFLTKDTAEDIVEFLLNPDKLNGYIDLDEHKAVILDFIGGEPLMNLEVMDYFVDYFKYRAFQLNHPWAVNYIVSMSSNGTLYRSEKFQKFLQKNKHKVYCGITIDGNKELHDSCRVYKDGSGSYDDVVKSVKKWVEDYPDPTTKVTIVPQNMDYLVDSVLHLWDLGVYSVPANCVYEDVWSVKDATRFYYKLKELADIILEKELYNYKHTTLFREHFGEPYNPEEDKNYCGGDGSMLAIGHDGRVYPCLRYMKYCMSNRDREELCIGNIYKGVDSAEDNEQLAEIQSLTRTCQSTEKCNSCPIGIGCSWCSAFNYDVFGTTKKRATFICDMHKAHVMGNVYYWNNLYKKLGLDKCFRMHIYKEWALEIIPEEEYSLLLQITK